MVAKHDVVSMVTFRISIEIFAAAQRAIVNERPVDEDDNKASEVLVETSR
jgi:hypothetical protein